MSEERADGAGPRSQRILVFDVEGGTHRRVLALAGTMDPVPEVSRVVDVDALADRLSTVEVDVLVAGAGLEGRAGFERLRVIREELPHLATVLAIADLDTHGATTVARAGAVDAVDPGEADERLGEAIERARMLASSVRTPGGELGDRGVGPRVLTVASASGGCGKTFLATNLAWMLHVRGGRRACIVDLDLQFGEVTASLGLEPTFTIADLAGAIERGEVVTAAEIAEQLEAVCTRHESGVMVLAAPDDPAQAERIRPADVGRIIDAARRCFDDVVIDTPPALGDVVRGAFDRSDEVLVLATLDVPSIRNLQVLLATVEGEDSSPATVRLVINKAERGGGIAVADVVAAIERPFDAVLPYAREVQRSINAGLPVLAHSPPAAVSQELLTSFGHLLPVERRGGDHPNRRTRLRRRPRSQRVAS